MVAFARVGRWLTVGIGMAAYCHAALAADTGVSRQDPTLKVAIDPTYFPLAYEDLPSPTTKVTANDVATGTYLHGYDVAYARKLAAKLHRKIVFVKMPFDRIGDALASGEVDIGFPDLPAVDRPGDPAMIRYLPIPEALVARRERGLKPGTDFSKLTIGVLTVSETRMFLAFKAVRGDVAKVRGFENDRTMMEALRRDEIDAVVLELPTALPRVARSSGGLIVLDRNMAQESLGFVVRPGDSALIQHISAAAKALSEDGTAAKIWANLRYK